MDAITTAIQCRLRGENMTIKEAYEIAVHKMTDIDKEIATLKGRRDAYDEMRSRQSYRCREMGGRIR